MTAAGTWEYHYVDANTAQGDALEEYLTRMGSVGWELCGFATADKTVGINKLMAVLKRQTLGYAAPPGGNGPSWQPDPGQRHGMRYWDGLRWTEHVSDEGQRSTDWPVRPA